jgi:hypothetical protein
MDIARATLEAAAAFSRAGLRHALGGGLASSIYGEVRTTLDADFALALPVLKVPVLLRVAEPQFYVDEAEMRAAALHTSMFVMTHRQDLVKVDAHVVRDVGHARAEFDRARWIQIGDDRGQDVLVASAEDVVLQKLVWYVRGGELSDRQLRDVRGILKARWQNLDRGYLRTWAAEQGTLEILERLWREAGGGAGVAAT